MRLVLQITIGGLLAGMALLAGLFLFFGPAQQFLADPELQSPKLMKVFLEIPPAPRISFSPSPAWLGFWLIGLGHAFVFYLVQPRFGRSILRQTICFAAVTWLTMVTWFEFWILWNMMHEPVTLLALELTLWIFVMLLEALALALFFRFSQKNVTQGTI
jgi:hypothetical protein